MVGRWLGVWLGVTLVVVVNTKVDLDSPLRLAHCRATCLYEMKVHFTTDEMCHTSSDCSQCWSGCSRLQGADSTSRSAYCDNTHCQGGCVEACKFYSSAPLHNPPVLLTHHEEVLSVSEHRVSWPSASGAPTVYVVMGRPLDKHWTQLGQTLEPTWGVSSTVESASVRVLVVDWRGLVKVLSPPPESPLVQVRTIIRSLGLDNVMGLRNHSESDGDNYTTNSSQVIPSPWPLRQVSMIRQSGLVLAQVSWHPLPSPQDYLVTWQLDGGILRGNLVTNSSTVTLSLWPDALYRIQVSLLSRDSAELESEPLVLDTHHTSRDAAHPHTSTRAPRHTPLVAGVAAAVTVFLAVTLTATWRWQHRLSLPHSKLLDEESGTPTLYRVFPPAVRPVGGQDFLPDMFSSTDNLLQVN